MDNLKQYKQAWKDQEYESNQVDKNTLSKMIHRRSSSIVKWIFYISLIEFSVFILLDIFSKKDWEEIKDSNMYTFTIISFVVFYAIILFFIYLFYKNYKSISVTNTSKGLMKSIIKTRQSVKYYIITNLIMLAIGTTTAAYISFKTPELEEMIASISESTGYNGSAIAWSITLIVVLLAVSLLFLVYQVLYGILLKKLKENYKELIN